MLISDMEPPEIEGLYKESHKEKYGKIHDVFSSCLRLERFEK